jgi:hypothetical protein|tara:strand:- start:63 stop:848 length:786 start_codon:yes stop_codon:yes gene_type:complete
MAMMEVDHYMKNLERGFSSGYLSNLGTDEDKYACPAAQPRWQYRIDPVRYPDPEDYKSFIKYRKKEMEDKERALRSKWPHVKYWIKDVRIGRVVELSEAERGICRAIAGARNQLNHEAGVEDQRVGTLFNDEEINLNGFGGEMAFCKLFNIFPDFTLELRGAETDMGDATLPSGHTVDVKTTVYPEGKLMAAPSEKQNHDVYALMTGEFSSYTFRGFIATNTLHTDEFLRPSLNPDSNLGLKVHWAYQDELEELSLAIGEQ